MVQQVIINGRPLDLDWEPSLKVGTLPLLSTPSIINNKMMHGVTINGYDYPPVDSGAVLYFPGLPGQGATIWDRSNQGNDGTITGATWVRLSSGLWVLSFDGDDKVNCGTDSSLFSADGSIVAWFLADGLGVNNLLVSSDPPGANIGDFFFRVDSVTDKLRATFDNPATTIFGNAAVSASTWYMAGLKWNTTEVALFQDGVKQADTSANDVTTIQAAQTAMMIGVNRVIPTFSMTGDIALVRVFNPALTDEEFARLFQQERHLFGV